VISETVGFVPGACSAGVQRAVKRGSTGALNARQELWIAFAVFRDYDSVRFAFIPGACSSGGTARGETRGEPWSPQRRAGLDTIAAEQLMGLDQGFALPVFWGLVSMPFAFLFVTGDL